LFLCARWNIVLIRKSARGWLDRAHLVLRKESALTLQRLHRRKVLERHFRLGHSQNQHNVVRSNPLQPKPLWLVNGQR
jgi:hypothetical protein